METPCVATDIFYLNENKEYTLLATKVLETILTDIRLNAQTTKLWQFLYSKARFDENLTVFITYQELANIFSKSVRTIARYISTLELAGYLVLKPNYGNDGSRLANTLHVRIPEKTIMELKNAKNRNSSKNDPHRTTTPPDKTDSVLSDNSGITNNNIIINTNNNKTVVVDFTETMFHVEQSSEHEIGEELEREEQLPTNLLEITHEITQLEREYHTVNQTFKLSDAAIQPILFLEVVALQSKLDSLKLHYDNQLKRWQDKQKQQQQSVDLTQNGDYFLAKAGQRVFNVFEINRLKKGLYALCAPENLPRLLNEVTYAIRFGELQKEQGTGKLLDIQHGISIALKLVREGRWKTPKGLLS